ncbi:hypothetical protein MKW92_035276 [Papaver armeniacum]|nr:hypothetical protein MKW92_035276 [Papaver armeniacum]
MSTRDHIPSQDTSQSVQQRARVVVSPPPPPPPSSQTDVRESMKRKRTSWVWNHLKGVLMKMVLHGGSVTTVKVVNIRLVVRSMEHII